MSTDNMARHSFNDEHGKISKARSKHDNHYPDVSPIEWVGTALSQPTKLEIIIDYSRITRLIAGGV